RAEYVRGSFRCRPTRERDAADDRRSTIQNIAATTNAAHFVNLSPILASLAVPSRPLLSGLRALLPTSRLAFRTGQLFHKCGVAFRELPENSGKFDLHNELLARNDRAEQCRVRKKRKNKIVSARSPKPTGGSPALAGR